MQKRILLALFTCFSFLCAGAQNTEKIERAYAFYKVTMPGIMPVDENGQPREMPANIERFIYIECRGTQMPRVTEVLYNNTAFTATITGLKDGRILVGKKAENGQDVQLLAKKGNRFWMISLQPANNKPQPPQGSKQVIIKSRIGSKPYKFYLYKETQLETLPSY